MKSSISALAALALASKVSAFWRLPCRSQTGIGRIDPIVFPGQVADHAHIVFGGGNMSFNAVGEDLVDSDCTSCQVVQDKSAYWTPPLYFQYTNGTTVMVPNVGGMLVYYLLYLDDLEAFPAGFQMLAGNPMLRNFTGPFPDTQLSYWPTNSTDDQFFLQQRALGFNCLNYNAAPEPSLYRHQFPTKEYMDAHCTDGLRLEMAFPSCGNGSATASDHQSHMRYPSLVKEGNCPEGFDHHYPFLFFETIWNTYAFAGEDGDFVLATGDPVGPSYHGDFMMGWESPEFLQNSIDTCTSMTGEIQDCPLFDIQSIEVGAQCTFDMPKAIKNDNPVGPRSGLPVDVPIQYGPQPATPYPVAGQIGVPTTNLPHTSAPASFSQRPDLSYTPANPSVTATAQGGIIVGAQNSGSADDKFAHSTAAASTAAPSSATPPAVAHSSAAPPAVVHSSAAAAAPPAPAITHAPSAVTSDVPSARTTYLTEGVHVMSVIEMIVEEVDVTVTASAAATGAAQKRNAEHHAHHHHKHHHHN